MKFYNSEFLEFNKKGILIDALQFNIIPPNERKDKLRRPISDTAAHWCANAARKNHRVLFFSPRKVSSKLDELIGEPLEIQYKKMHSFKYEDLAKL